MVKVENIDRQRLNRYLKSILPEDKVAGFTERIIDHIRIVAQISVSQQSPNTRREKIEALKKLLTDTRIAISDLGTAYHDIHVALQEQGNFSRTNKMTFKKSLDDLILSTEQALSKIPAYSGKGRPKGSKRNEYERYLIGELFEIFKDMTGKYPYRAGGGHTYPEFDYFLQILGITPAPKITREIEGAIKNS